MESVNDNKLDKLNKRIQLLTFFVIILIVLVICFFVIFFLLNKNETKGFSNQETTTYIKDSKLYELGVLFYESFYWRDAGKGDDNKRIEFLEQYKDIGIKVSLENILRYYVTTDKYSNSIEVDMNLSVFDRVTKLADKLFPNYDLNNTKVIIYPKEPYNKKDYTIEFDIVYKY